MQVTKQKFSDGPQIIDGNEYTECTFDRCKIIYRGGGVPTIVDCTFNDCTWHFEEGAERTLSFMKLLYHGMGEGGAKLVESAFIQIREPVK